MKIVAGVVALLGACGVGYWVFAPDSLRPLAWKSDFEQFCRQCEDTLKERLRSPSTYTRTECKGPYTETATLNSYREYEPSLKNNVIDKFRRTLIESGDMEITRAFLKYEAANAFGTPIGGLEICELAHSNSQSLVDASKYSGPRVGGFDKTGWLINQLKSQP